MAEIVLAIHSWSVYINDMDSKKAVHRRGGTPNPERIIIMKTTTKTVYFNEQTGTAFFFVEPAPETFIVQRVDSGTYDYSHCGSIEAAVQEVTAEWFTEGSDMTRDDAEKQSRDTLESYTLDEAIDEACKYSGGFLESLGYIEMVDVEEI